MKKLLDPEDLISQTEAAELRGVTRASINELVTRGRLRSVTIGGKVLLYRAEVEAFERSKGGRPLKASAAKATPAKRGSKK
jgi:excisionase family DNA binding protein